MDVLSDHYDHVVAVYIRAIRLDSPDASDAVQEIFVKFGSRAALRATLVIALVKMEVLERKPLTTLAAFAYMLDPFPDVFPILEQALTCWLRDWTTHHPAWVYS